MKTNLIRAALAAALLSPVAAIASPMQPYVEIMGPSYHTVRTTSSGFTYNNATPGIGLGMDLDNHVSIAAGVYRNSFYKVGTYVEADWLPLRLGRFGLGAGAGLATGYEGCVPLGRYFTPIAGLIMTADINRVVRAKVRVLPMSGMVTGKSGFGAVFNLSLDISI